MRSARTGIVLDERDIQTEQVPGRDLKWLFKPGDGKAEGFSMNVIEIQPGNTVKPAHCHPNEEEVIYVMRGAGLVYIDGEVSELGPGCAALFPPGAVHMVRNNGHEVMKIACFFSPPVDFSRYQYFEDVEFPMS